MWLVFVGKMIVLVQVLTVSYIVELCKLNFIVNVANIIILNAINLYVQYDMRVVIKLYVYKY